LEKIRCLRSKPREKTAAKVPGLGKNWPEFSEPWKISAFFFQGLEKRLLIADG
jgi:hypothetical protein